jgi:hypothetical protein
VSQPASGRGEQHDPVVRALEVLARTLASWEPGGDPDGEWDPSRYLPGGDRHIPKVMIYGTAVTPTPFIPFGDPEPEVLTILAGRGNGKLARTVAWLRKDPGHRRLVCATAERAEEVRVRYGLTARQVITVDDLRRGEAIREPGPA